MRLLSLLALAVAGGALLAACGEGGEAVPGDVEVAGVIPWTPPETYVYEIKDKNGPEGTGTLTVEEEGGELVLTQVFDVPEEEIVDTVSVRADAQTLRPSSAERRLEGPQGLRHWTATYDAQQVTVFQETDDDERTDVVDLPPKPYDSWADLFLWRTLDFREGLEVAYRDVISVGLDKPEVIDLRLEVKELEEIEVPAGTFEAWRTEIESGGSTQKAWFTNDEAHMLVRYENGQQTFRLASYETP
jgi:hypothetical protein